MPIQMREMSTPVQVREYFPNADIQWEAYKQSIQGPNVGEEIARRMASRMPTVDPVQSEKDRIYSMVQDGELIPRGVVSQQQHQQVIQQPIQNEVQNNSSGFDIMKELGLDVNTPNQVQVVQQQAQPQVTNDMSIADPYAGLRDSYNQLATAAARRGISQEQITGFLSNLNYDDYVDLYLQANRQPSQQVNSIAASSDSPVFVQKEPVSTSMSGIPDYYKNMF